MKKLKIANDIFMLTDEIAKDILVIVKNLKYAMGKRRKKVKQW